MDDVIYHHVINGGKLDVSSVSHFLRLVHAGRPQSIPRQQGGYKYRRHSYTLDKVPYLDT
jgi:hypothetical protein